MEQKFAIWVHRRKLYSYQVAGDNQLPNSEVTLLGIADTLAGAVDFAMTGLTEPRWAKLVAEGKYLEGDELPQMQKDARCLCMWYREVHSLDLDELTPEHEYYAVEIHAINGGWFKDPTPRTRWLVVGFTLSPLEGYAGLCFHTPKVIGVAEEPEENCSTGDKHYRFLPFEVKE